MTDQQAAQVAGGADPFNVPALARVEPRRHKQWGGTYLPMPAGFEDPAAPGKERYFRRVTTLAGALDDKNNLMAWGERMSVKGVLSRADLTQLARVTPLDDREAWRDICERGKDSAKAGERRDMGTAFHRLAQADDAALILTGNRLDTRSVPEDMRHTLDSYRRIVDRAGMTFTDIERMVCNPLVMAAGTIDRIGLARGWELPRIIDLKSGKDVTEWGQTSISVQVATYAYAVAMIPTHWNAKRGAEQYEPMPQIDLRLACVVHVDAVTGEAELYHVDIETGWARAQVAATVITMRSDKTPVIVPFVLEGDVVTVDPEADIVPEDGSDMFGVPAADIHAALDDRDAERPAGRTVEAERAITAATIAGDPELEAATDALVSGLVAALPDDPQVPAAPAQAPAPAKRRRTGPVSREEQADTAKAVLAGLPAAVERRRAEARFAVDLCLNQGGLADLWDQYQDVWTDDLTAAGQARLAELANADAAAGR
jgi:hypothetical protein